jgi:uncharacterized protein
MKKLLIVCCLALGVVAQAGAQAAAQPAAQKIRVLILTGNSDWSHPWQGTAPFMQGMLNNTGRFDARLEEEVRGITAETLANYDVLIDYYYGPRWPAETEKAVEDFVKSGKGMVGVHGITYGPFFGQAGGSATEPRRLEGEPWAAFSDMIGMTFDDPKVKGGTGKTEPAIWTVPYGQGRVVMIVLGHDLLAMSQPGFMDAFTRSAEWAATGNVAPGSPVMSPPTSLVAPAAHH